MPVHIRHFGNVFFSNRGLGNLALVGHALLHLFDAVLQLEFAVAELRGELVLLRADGLVLLLAQAFQTPHRLLHGGRCRGLADAHVRSGLVHQVDGFVGQEAV